MTREHVGILAGTFDPIHDGHIALAETAHRQAELDRVVFLPEAQPRRKVHVSLAYDRLTQIERRISDINYLEAQLIDQPCFSVASTLPAIAQLYPNADYALLIGSDIVEHLGNWEDFEIIRRTMRILVGLRSGYDKSILSAQLDRLEVDYDFVETEYSHLASSQLRAARAATSSDS